nr:gamma-glutamyl-gamma-aminobutyrate hydrolase family protein [Actinomyces sp. 186855]
MLDDGCPEPGALELGTWAGVLITGSPLSLTGPLSPDPAHERLRERVLALSLRLVQEDVPTLGLCFGLQSIVLALGGSLRDDVGEELQAPVMTLTEAGAADPLTAALAPSFRAYVGHSQSVTGLPGGGVVLATGTRCPIQMGRWGRNVYGTQFHPEITTAGMRVRIDAYGDAYYPAHERAAVIERCDAADVRPANRVVSSFVQRYRGRTRS